MAGAMQACPSTGLCCYGRCLTAPQWPQGQVVPVRESLALSALFFFHFAPQAGVAASPLFSMWDQASPPLP